MNSDKIMFKNTFIPDCENTELTIGDVITAMRFGFIEYEDLPQEVQNAVDEEIERMRQAEEGENRNKD